jgi:hypothetical protein
MISQYIWPVVLVGLPSVNIIDSITINKLDYTLPYAECQEEKYKNTMEFNYITTQELLESNNKKYLDILW